MTQYREDYVRFLGNDFLAELLALFEKGSHVALLGPPNSAKSLLLDELRWQTRERRVVNIFWDNRMSPDKFLQHLSEQLDAKTPVSGQNLSLIVEKMLRRAAAQKPIGIVVSDLPGFPTRIARSILNALNACSKEDDEMGNRLSAIITGRSDFIHLSYGSNSPYRHARKFVIYGLDRPWARAFFCRLRMLQSGMEIPKSILDVPVTDFIDEEGFQELYSQTGGYAHFIQEIGINSVRHSYRDGYKPLPKQWGIKDVRAIVKRYREMWMTSDNMVRTLVRAVEHIPDAFNHLETLVSKKQPFYDTRNEPAILEVSGIARRYNDGRLELASQLWKDFLKDFLGNREKADAFAWQERWDDVWRLYEEDVEKHEWDRPISGNSRFRLREVINVWRRSLMREVTKGPEAVAHRFLNGLKYFYGFEDGGIGSLKEERIVFFKTQAIESASSISNLMSEDAEAFHDDDTAQYFLFNKRHLLFSLSKTPLPAPYEESNPILAVWKLGFESEVDSDEQTQLIEAIDNFWKVYHIAQENEYERNTGIIRYNHRKVLDTIMSTISCGDMSFPDILRMATDELVCTAGYYRILISLVDPTRKYLYPAVSACKRAANDFKHPKTYRIDPDTLSSFPLDAQQWVAKHRLPIVVPDTKSLAIEGVYSNSEQAALTGIKAFAVIPMQIEANDVIGTIHFERGDRSLPTDEEVSLMLSLSKQLALFIEQKRRETLLEQALNAIDAPIRILDSQIRSLFTNTAAAQYFDEIEGWHSSGQAQCNFHKTIDSNCLCKRLLDEEAKAATLHRIEPPIAEKWDIRAIDNVTYRFEILPEAKGPVGLVERITDLRDLYELVEVFHDWVKEEGTQRTAQAILSYFRNGFPAGKIFLYEKLGDNFVFRSLEEYGLEKKANRDRFIQREIVLERELLEHDTAELYSKFDPAIFEINPTQNEHIRKTTPLFGLPRYFIQKAMFSEELEKEKDRRWIEAPLVVGKSIVGKLTLRWPKHPEELKWGLLRTTIAMAATALYEETRAEKEILEKASMALNISYALRTRAASLEHYFYSLRKKISPEYAKLMEGMRKEIDFFRRAAIFSSRHFDSNLAANGLRIDLREIVQKVVDAAIDPRVKYVFPRQSVWIMANPYRMEELVLELLTNAREFAPSEKRGGSVEVRLRAEGNQAVMEFIDNGPGIDQSIRPRLFEMYQCYPVNRMGLGLSYVRNIAKAHNGTVEEISNDSPGAHFVVRLPLNKAQEEKENEL